MRQAMDKDYFTLIDKIWNHNQKSGEKYIFFIAILSDDG
jgi:hypothetical protein